MSDRIKLVPSGRFITDQEGRKVCEMMWPGSPSEQEEIKRRIVAAYNACRWDHQPEARNVNSVWFIDDNVPGANLGYRAIIDEDGYVVCSPSPMGEANARLIAAAPDLLEALQDCIEQIAQMQPLFDDEDGAIRAALDKAQRAVDKATVGSERRQ